MAWREPVQTNDVVRLSFYWQDSSGVPLTTLSPVPTCITIAPNGTRTTGLAMTQVGSSEVWYRDVTMSSAGVWYVLAVCTDTDVAVQYTDIIAVPVANTESTQADITAILAQVNYIGNPSVTINTAGNVGNGTRLYIIIGDAYVSALSRQITFSSLSTADLTTATSIGLYIDDQLTATATATSATSCTVELTSAQTSTLQPGLKKYDLRADFGASGDVTIIHRGIVDISLPTPGA